MLVFRGVQVGSDGVVGWKGVCGWGWGGESSQKPDFVRNIYLSIFPMYKIVFIMMDTGLPCVGEGTNFGDLRWGLALGSGRVCHQEIKSRERENVQAPGS